MTAFLSILSKYFPDIDITSPAFVYLNIDSHLVNKDFIAYGFINSIHYNINNKKNTKFGSLHDSITGNIFVTDDTKKRYLNIFSHAQRTYYAFSRLARFYKIKHSLQYDMNTDLCMTPLSTLKSSVKLKLYDDKTRTSYTFRLSDLLNIIQTALSNSPEFFAEPLTIKNPYVNMNFTYAQLYTIYFKIRNSDMIMPVLFHQYFIHNFNISTFCKYNECYIRDIAIKNYTKNTSNEQQYNYIMKMLLENKTSLEGIVIHPDFKRKYIIQAFSKYLYDYLTMSYTLNPTLRYITREALRRKLVRFSRLNPTFGRKIYYNIKRNSTNTRNIPYRFRFDADRTSFHEDNNIPILNFRGALNNVASNIQNEISQIVSYIDVSNIPSDVGIHFVSNVNTTSPRNAEQRNNTPLYNAPLYNTSLHNESLNNALTNTIISDNPFFDEAVQADALQNITGLDGSESEYSEANEIDEDMEEVNDVSALAEHDDNIENDIPTYNITMPVIQNMVVFNEDSLGYISNAEPLPPPPLPPPLPPIIQPPPPPPSTLMSVHQSLINRMSAGASASANASANTNASASEAARAAGAIGANANASASEAAGASEAARAAGAIGVAGTYGAHEEGATDTSNIIHFTSNSLNYTISRV